MEKLIITPKTKIYDLLSDYPELEELLISMAPQFEKLRNPVLRKTITRITNLSQAAAIAGINVEEMVSTLRKEAGQEEMTFSSEMNRSYNTSVPAWFDKNKVVNNIDIRVMLHDGEQPVHEVLASLKKLKDNEILKVIAPFLPAPLLDKSISLAYNHWVHKESEDEYWIYFSK
ncbi:MAG: DUF1858 domain-containing protein [Bacteroidales bacterium]|nr:DUF1858 domain-containing protein [Bacteroidales bacterium]